LQAGIPQAEAGSEIGNNGLDAGLKASSTRTARHTEFSATVKLAAECRRLKPTQRNRKERLDAGLKASSTRTAWQGFRPWRGLQIKSQAYPGLPPWANHFRPAGWLWRKA